MPPAASEARLARFGTVAAIASLLALGIASSGGGGVAAARSSTRCVVPGVGKPLHQVWRPDMQAALRYKRTRAGDIAFAVRTESRFYAYRPDHIEWSASVLKAMLLVAYLDRPSVARRDLTDGDRVLLNPMITVSDNDAATEVRSIVGNSGLSALARRVGMTSFEPAAIWGDSHITARDQTKFFLHIDSFIPSLHRAYAMRLLASVTPSQRWGISEVAPKGWKLYFKGGWGYGTGLVDHQVALLVRGCTRVSVAVLTMHDGDHAYGKETLEGMFSRLLRGLPTGASRRPA
jgi:Beta-lactamase enzyme family